MTPTFLRAEWRYLVMLNYEIDPARLQTRLPAGTELDFHEGRTFVSMVGFLFLQTRVLGLLFPGHVNFEEVNLRFYVRRRHGNDWHRGVVFVRELVPRRAIAWLARTCYGEPYTALPMRHRIIQKDDHLEARYGWRRRGRWESLRATGSGPSQPMAADSLDEFIAQHFWGYTARKNGTSEFQVHHPRWRIWRATEHRFDADVATLYGPDFVETLAAPPASAFIAEGSPISVQWKRTFYAG